MRLHLGRNLVSAKFIKGQRRHTGNVTKAVPIEPFPFVANFAPDKIDA